MDKAQEIVLDYSTERMVIDKDFQNSLFRNISDAGKVIEDLYGCAQDIEGVVKGGEIYVVQTRPQIWVLKLGAFESTQSLGFCCLLSFTGQDIQNCIQSALQNVVIEHAWGSRLYKGKDILIIWYGRLVDRPFHCSCNEFVFNCVQNFNGAPNKLQPLNWK